MTTKRNPHPSLSLDKGEAIDKYAMSANESSKNAHRGCLVQRTHMTIPRPYALLAEITYRCPLHCPYCSNPIAVHNRNLEGGFPATPGKTGLQELAPPCNAELSTDEWKRVIREAADLGILQIGFSGGEPLARRDLPDLIRAAREANLYS